MREDWPTGHGIHVDEPAELYVPAGQLTQAEPPVPYVPAGHAKQEDALVLIARLDWPTGHRVHEEDPGPL